MYMPKIRPLRCHESYKLVPHTEQILYKLLKGRQNNDLLKMSPGLLWWLKMVESPPAMQETWVQSLGWEDPLEKEMATHSSILAWEIAWTEPGRLQSMGLQKSQT